MEPTTVMLTVQKAKATVLIRTLRPPPDTKRRRLTRPYATEI